MKKDLLTLRDITLPELNEIFALASKLKAERGKVSFTPEQLAENYGVVYDEILRMKPAAAKGRYVKSITVSSTMGPGVPVDSAVNRAYTTPAE